MYIYIYIYIFVRPLEGARQLAGLKSRRVAVLPPRLACRSSSSSSGGSSSGGGGGGGGGGGSRVGPEACSSCGRRG